MDFDRAVVITNDRWNAGRMDNVIVLPVDPYDPAATYTSYDSVVELEGETIVVLASQLLPLHRDHLATGPIKFDDDTMAAIGAALTPMFTSTATKRDMRRPLRRAYPGQLRWADLHIPGEGQKVALVVSTEDYGRQTGWQLIVVCRTTTSMAKVRRFEVPFGHRGDTKVVVHHVQAVPAVWLTERNARDAAVGSKELADVRAQLSDLLGLPVWWLPHPEEVAQCLT